MSYASESGYTARTIESMMLDVMAGVNAQFSLTYTAETFVGTNFYKYFYSLIQLAQENEVKTAEIFLKLQDYFAITNERISRPVTTNPGLIEKLGAEGYTASVKKPIDADAGKVFVCVDTDQTAQTYAAKKLAINTILKNSTVAGVVTQGTEVSAIVLSNGQSFDFKFLLPNRIAVLLKLTITLSENNQVAISDPDDTKLLLVGNILADYRLGKNFEPDRYFSISDAPWAQSVLLQWSDDNGVTYQSTVYDAEFDDLFLIDLANITLIEA